MLNADQILQNWQSPRVWFYAGGAVVFLFVVRQLWRLSDKLTDSTLAKVSKRFREMKEIRQQQRRRLLELLRNSAEARLFWLFREMRLRHKLVAKMVTGAFLALIGPASTFTLVVGFGTRDSIVARAVFFILGGVCAAGLGMIVESWFEWHTTAKEIRDLLYDAYENNPRADAVILPKP